jgi:hypothetical protein
MQNDEESQEPAGARQERSRRALGSAAGGRQGALCDGMAGKW